MLVAGLSATTGCSSDRAGKSASMLGSLAKRVAVRAMRSSEPDPCTFLAADEAEPYVGRLSTPPYRADDGRASTAGDECVYRAGNGHELTIKPSGRGGEMMGKVMTGVPQTLGAVLTKGGMTGADTLANRVMQQGPAGPWDKATWIPGGSLFVAKGDAMIVIDMTGASGKQADALEIAKLIVPRIGHPLSYDGAKAVALVPKPFEHPAKACDLVPRAAVESAIGALSAPPVNGGDGTGCTYTVQSSDGTRTYAVEFNWEGGAKNYNMLKNGMSTVGGLMGMADVTGTLDSIPNSPQAGQMIGALMKLAGGGDMSKASGAATKVGFKTDTTLIGPWDNAALLHGTQLVAVKHDVFVGMGLESADYDSAKALLAAICSRIR
jgi:hypothetical protein